MLNSKTGIFAALAIVSLAASSALAQQAVTTPINNWNYQHHASTATEGFLRGAASVIQAQGQKNLLDSMATVNYQEARRRAIENNKLYVRTFIENKDAIREYRERYAPVPPTKEEWEQVIKASLPDRLTTKQFDAHTGKIVWPHVLRMQQYAAVRNRIDTLLAQRTPENSGDGSPSQRELSTLIDGMTMLLKSNVKNLSVSQYGNAKMFLRSLAYEMTFPIDKIAAAPAKVAS